MEESEKKGFVYPLTHWRALPEIYCYLVFFAVIVKLYDCTTEQVRFSEFRFLLLSIIG